MQYGQQGGAVSFLKSPILWILLGIVFLGFFGFRYIKGFISAKASQANTVVATLQTPQPTPSPIRTPAVDARSSVASRSDSDGYVAVSPPRARASAGNSTYSPSGHLPASGPTFTIAFPAVLVLVIIPLGYYYLSRRSLKRAYRDITILS